jgi:hypothetical protein
MARRCFVISPIGEAGSPVRDHADDVFEYIIKPAMAEVGIDVYRADHDQKVGRITEHMFDSILTDDLCIAVLSFQNPNVFYELAVAQCAARPVIILNEKGHPLPFDIKDLRVVEYTLRPKMIFEKVYVRQIVEMVRNLEAANWQVGVPFGTNLSPLGRSVGAVNHFTRLEQYGPSDQWLDLIRKADRAVDLSGITLRWWTKLSQFADLLVARAKAGCVVRIMTLHPDNEALPHYMHPRIKPDRTESADAHRSYKYFTDVAASHPNIHVRLMRTGCHHQQLFRADDHLLFSLVLFSEGSNSPTIT